MYEYNRIIHEAREHASRLEHEAAAERIARHARGARKQRQRLHAALKHLRPARQG